MNLGFKPQFKEKILSGEKIHTIREDPLDRWHPGRLIHFATGIRTKNYDCFKKDECVSIQLIEIHHSVGHAEVLIDKEYYGEIFHHGLDDIYEWTTDLEILARNDGFDDVEDFFAWFNKDFSGKLIHWTETRYHV